MERMPSLVSTLLAADAPAYVYVDQLQVRTDEVDDGVRLRKRLCRAMVSDSHPTPKLAGKRVDLEELPAGGGLRVTLNQPTAEAMELLFHEYAGEVTWLEVALDIETADELEAERVLVELLEHLDDPGLRNRPEVPSSVLRCCLGFGKDADGGSKRDDGGEPVSWSSYTNPVALQTPKRRARGLSGRERGWNIKAYADQPSRWTGRPVAHFELFAKGAGEVARVFGDPTLSAKKRVQRGLDTFALSRLLLDEHALAERVLAALRFRSIKPDALSRLFPEDSEEVLERRRRAAAVGQVSVGEYARAGWPWSTLMDRPSPAGLRLYAWRSPLAESVRFDRLLGPPPFELAGRFTLRPEQQLWMR
jgi:hypothetical protein